ncbi:hypothetical protein OPV22_019101 [Ensete ventricosum]|uniref:GBF-interacting protein 1 N-terminal domain-containing protein n=1 Tax=Ensete ventricosum TaxID=4639 RepID=A0AAV8QX38_ENSVE|nr:hypothetical protein OPV22_019101 [Ensete ventricosum]
MSGGGGGGAGSRGNGAASAAPIPAGSRKLVQSLKEIVNCSETEIYAMLRECNMDPNEAVHRLLSQDAFHEVRSKRDKKKEIREPPESRSRTVSNSSSRGARGSSDRGGRSTSQSSSVDYGASKGKLIHKKENGTSAVLFTASVLESSMISSNLPQKPAAPSNSASMGDTIQAANISDGISMSVQSSSGFQNSWLGKPGHLSMADIVKMGRPQGKPSGMPVVASERYDMAHTEAKQSPTAVLPSESDKITDSFQESTQVSEYSYDIGIAKGQQISHDGWPLVDEQPTESSRSEEIQGPVEGHHDKTLPSESRPISISSDMQRQVDNSADADADAYHLNEGLLKSTNSYNSQRLELDHHEGSFPAGDSMDISSAAVNLGQLSLHEETSTEPTVVNPAVIIPDHLRVTNVDCAHLSFGSFVSGAFSGSFPSKQLKSNLEVAPVMSDASATDNSDVRNHEYYSDELLNPTLTENIASRSSTDSENLDGPSASQTEVVKTDSLDATHEIQYNLPSVSNYAFPSSTQPNATSYAYPQENSQMQSLSSFPSLMQPDSLQNSSLAASIPSLRDFDLSLSPLLTTQSMPMRYSTSLSSIGGPTISMSEALNPGLFSNPQSTPPSLTSTTMFTSPALHQHLPVHHYSQPALPLGHFANMMSYPPFLPQSYTYLPSFQQAYTANSPFHQSPGAVPGAGMKYSQPQFKNSLSVTSLPQASAIASAYGGLGSSANIPGGFTLNHTSGSASSTTGFDESLSLQNKEGSHYMPLQQSENPNLWLHGAGSRTMPALPASTFYNYQGQSQQSGFRQSPQASHLGALGYPNLYHSPAGLSREHRQSTGEGSLNGPQTTSQSQPANQIWQHGY